MMRKFYGWIDWKFSGLHLAGGLTLKSDKEKNNPAFGSTRTGTSLAGLFKVLLQRT
jgi:hypothetical protein